MAPYLAALVGADRFENWAGLNVEQSARARSAGWIASSPISTGNFRELPSGIVHREMATPETFQQYLNTPGGSLYGFAPESRGFMPRAATAIDGLYLASAFTGGGGFTGAILGGGWAVRAAMRPET